ncbi:MULTISPECIES: DUF4255 domain-containing protein [Niastella]|uniref:DUF4255 domain-containing protein n=1 Tax=Niastella soli TaxID=2821487 RepID=A0ABS3Z5Q6_9BACT|nr:DUF4255 domain-containing protein [Niastella soli]MBO9205494.1 DUF4255 domain-containing protein [Niastella soli]
MSTALAIASVTHVLKDLLNNKLIDHDITGSLGGNVTITALPPDKIDVTTATESQLNLFMYQATPNQGWRNAGLPSLNTQGDRINNPPLALDLHYLLTAYGAEELHAEILLGYGMQLFHETPVLTRNAIRKSLTDPPVSVPGGGLPPTLRAISTSELADQVEQIKITPEILNTEEISKLWTAFGARYRPNAAYKVSVVLIESRKSTRPALPVQTRNIYVFPFKRPVIEKISSQAMPGSPVVENQKILATYSLILTGENLKGENTFVDIDGMEVAPAINEVTDSEIHVALPTGLQAGIHGVQVMHKILMGSPPLRQLVSSNVQAFVLNPTVEVLAVTPVSGDQTRSATISLKVTPAIAPMQRMVLFLNEYQSTRATPLAYSFQVPVVSLLSPPAPAEIINIGITGVAAGIYLVRLQVDGAESPLQVDAAHNYNAPQVTI